MRKAKMYAYMIQNQGLVIIRAYSLKNAIRYFQYKYDGVENSDVYEWHGNPTDQSPVEMGYPELF